LLSSLGFKALLGALVVLIMALLARSKNYYIAGLIPLFPTFALMAHWIVGSERGVEELKKTVIFGAWAMIPYALYLFCVYWLIDYWRLEATLLGASLVWILAASILIYSYPT